MALPSSGPLSLDDIAGEFGGTAPDTLSEYYGADTIGGVPASGTLAISDFYGTSDWPPPIDSSFCIFWFPMRNRVGATVSNQVEPGSLTIVGTATQVDKYTKLSDPSSRATWQGTPFQDLSFQNNVIEVWIWGNNMENWAVGQENGDKGWAVGPSFVAKWGINAHAFTSILGFCSTSDFNCITYNMTNTSLQVYVNKVLRRTVAMTGGMLSGGSTTDGYVSADGLGTSPTANPNYIADVKLYKNINWTSTQVAASYDLQKSYYTPA